MMLSLKSAPLTLDEIRRRLVSDTTDRHFYLFSEVDSTNDSLRELAGRGAREGTVVVAEAQRRGRGRLGRPWFSPSGFNIYASVLFRPPIVPDDAPAFSFIASLALVDALESLGVSAEIKWPNDVLVDDRKVAGILLESTGDTVICGIGVNVNTTEDGLPPDARTPAGSLLTATSREHDRAELLARLLVELQHRYDEWIDLGLGLFVRELEQRDALRGRVVTVGGVSGTATGIAPDGRLRVRAEDGSETLVASGEVTELQVSG